MAKTVTLELTDIVYKLLSETSAQSGQTPEQMILEWVEERIQQTIQDPLLQLAGIIEAEVTDVAERHDDYIGQALKKDNG